MCFLYIVYIRRYICRFCQCWHERICTCTYIIIHMNVVMQCGYIAATKRKTLFVQACVKTFVCMYICSYTCTYLHLMYTSLRSCRASHKALGKPKMAIQLVH